MLKSAEALCTPANAHKLKIPSDRWPLIARETHSMNLRALVRVDPLCAEIVDFVRHVCIYEFIDSWKRLEHIEGPLFTICRREAPYFRLLLLNRKSFENETFDCDQILSFTELTEDTLSLEMADGRNFSLWIPDATEFSRLQDTLFNIRAFIDSGKIPYFPPPPPSSQPQNSGSSLAPQNAKGRKKRSGSNYVPVQEKTPINEQQQHHQQQQNPNPTATINNTNRPNSNTTTTTTSNNNVVTDQFRVPRYQPNVDLIAKEQRETQQKDQQAKQLRELQNQLFLKQQQQQQQQQFQLQQKLQEQGSQQQQQLNAKKAVSASSTTTTSNREVPPPVQRRTSVSSLIDSQDQKELFGDFLAPSFFISDKDEEDDVSPALRSSLSFTPETLSSVLLPPSVFLSSKKPSGFFDKPENLKPFPTISDELLGPDDFGPSPSPVSTFSDDLLTPDDFVSPSVFSDRIGSLSENDVRLLLISLSQDPLILGRLREHLAPFLIPNLRPSSVTYV